MIHGEAPPPPPPLSVGEADINTCICVYSNKSGIGQGRSWRSIS
jgi:hypothetical protein